MKKMKEIAEELNVSIATVSYVYNNKWREKKISEELAKKIKEKLEEENYKPDFLGLQLKTKKTKTIGIVFADLTRNFNLSILSGIEEVLSAYDYFTLVSNSSLGEKEISCINTLFERKVEGLIITPQKNEESLSEIKRINEEIPVVLTDNYFPGENIDFVVSDNKWGSYKGVEYLINEGRRKIGYIGSGKDLSALNDRFEGYLKALKENKIEIKENRICKKILKKEDVYSALKEIFRKEKIDAIFVESFLYFKYGFKFFYEKGIEIGKDIILIGFDPIDLRLDEIQELHFNEIVKEKIPFIQQKGKEIGKKAANILMDKLRGEEVEVKRVFIKPELKFYKGEENV